MIKAESDTLKDVHTAIQRLERAENTLTDIRELLEYVEDVIKVERGTDEYIEPIFQQDKDAYSKKSNDFWTTLDKTEYNAFRLGVYAAGLIFGEVTGNADD